LPLKYGYAGIRVDREYSKVGWAGIDIRKEDGRTFVGNLVPGGPGEDAGLDRGDEIVALDGRAVREKEAANELQLHVPGDKG
jgi:C-terminal processing protease CtpA/Prc